MNLPGSMFTILVRYYNGEPDTFYAHSRQAAEQCAERLLKEDDEVFSISITDPLGNPAGIYTRTAAPVVLTPLSQADEDRKTVINLLERALSVLKQEEPK